MSSYFMLRMLRRKRQKTQCMQQVQAIEGNNEMHEKNITINKCRVCLNNGSIPITGETSVDICEALYLFAGIENIERDLYPKYLCNACHSLLQGAILLRKTAQETDKLLKQMHRVPTGVNSFDIASNTSESDNTPSAYNCSDTKFSSKNTDIPIKSMKQPKNVRIQCPVCHRLLTVHLYKRHLDMHQTSSHLICDVCGKLYRKDNLVRHLQLHTFELPFQCQMCPYRGRFMESLKIHMRTHTGHKPFSCEKCDLRFLTRSNLNRHLLTHKKDRPFKCIECGRGFYTKRDMDIHFKSDHTGVKDFACNVCGNKYGTRKALMRHELRVHKRDKMAKGRMPLYLQAEYRKIDDVV